MEGVSQLERDNDVVRGVYMLPSQREAYERILQAALSARAQGEAVFWEMARRDTVTGEWLPWNLCPKEIHDEIQRGEWASIGTEYRSRALYTTPAARAVDVDGLRSALKQAAADLKAYGHLAAAGRALAALTQPEAE